MEPEAPAEASPAAETVAAPPLLPPCPASATGLDNRIAGQICQRVRTEPAADSLKVEGHAISGLSVT